MRLIKNGPESKKKEEEKEFKAFNEKQKEVSVANPAEPFANKPETAKNKAKGGGRKTLKRKKHKFTRKHRR